MVNIVPTEPVFLITRPDRQVIIRQRGEGFMSDPVAGVGVDTGAAVLSWGDEAKKYVDQAESVYDGALALFTHIISEVQAAVATGNLSEVAQKSQNLSEAKESLAQALHSKGGGSAGAVQTEGESTSA